MSDNLLTNNVPPAKFAGRRLRRFEIVLMAIITCIGAGMIVGAWFSIGHVRGEAVVNIAMLGIVLPLCFYAMLSVIGWQRTTAAGGELGRFASWCMRNRLNQAIPFFCLVLILGMANNINRALDRPYAANAPANDTAFDESFDTGMRRECRSSALKGLGAAANGPQGAQVQSRVQTYCDCVANRLEAQYSISELSSLMGDNERISHDPKVRGVITACQNEALR